MLNLNMMVVVRFRKFSPMIRVMLTAVLTYLFFLTLLFVFQRKLQYFPMGKVQAVSAYGLTGFSEEILTTKDETKILSWYRPAKNNEKIILYFHGNAGNLGDRSHKFAAFAADGFGVLAISYRGYSGSAGKPSETGLLLDADAALQFLLDQGYSEKNIILFGESLGSGVAVQLAAKHSFSAIILESPFSSIVGVAQKTYWFVPVNLLLKDKFESIKFLPKIYSPILIFHGTKDPIVLYSEGKRLFDAATAPKKLITIEGAGHLNFGEEFLLHEMEKFLRGDYTE